MCIITCPFCKQAVGHSDACPTHTAPIAKYIYDRRDEPKVRSTDMFKWFNRKRERQLLLPGMEDC